MNEVLRAVAARLHHAYNPRQSAERPAGSKWIAVALVAARSSAGGEELAAVLHTAYVADIPEQREHGWPPLSDSERDRWLNVASQVEAERAAKAAGS